MANTREDTLLDRPGIGAVPQHLQIVIGFQKENVDVSQRGLYVGGDVAEVSRERNPDALAVEDEAAGIGGIVGNGEGQISRSPTQNLWPA